MQDGVAVPATSQSQLDLLLLGLRKDIALALLVGCVCLEDLDFKRLFVWAGALAGDHHLLHLYVLANGCKSALLILENLYDAPLLVLLVQLLSKLFLRTKVCQIVHDHLFLAQTGCLLVLLGGRGGLGAAKFERVEHGPGHLVILIAVGYMMDRPMRINPL